MVVPVMPLSKYWYANKFANISSFKKTLQHIIKMTDSSEAFKTWLKGKTLRDKAVEVILITVSILFYFVLRLICFLVH